jgi:hypothetical protein
MLRRNIKTDIFGQKTTDCDNNNYFWATKRPKRPFVAIFRFQRFHPLARQKMGLLARLVTKT